MNGNTRSITVRLTPRQAVGAAVAAGVVAFDRNDTWRRILEMAAANIEEALREAGWEKETNGRVWIHHEDAA